MEAKIVTGDAHHLVSFRVALVPYVLPNNGVVATRLHRVAEMAAGLSGRILRNLPEKALAMSMTKDTCTIGEALEAVANCLASVTINN